MHCICKTGSGPPMADQEWWMKFVPLSAMGAAAAGWLVKVLMVDKLRARSTAETEGLHVASVTTAADSLFKRAETLIDTLQGETDRLRSEREAIKVEREAARRETELARIEAEKLRLALSECLERCRQIEARPRPKRRDLISE
jgi:hypothetical protein